MHLRAARRARGHGSHGPKAGPSAGREHHGPLRCGGLGPSLHCLGPVWQGRKLTASSADGRSSRIRGLLLKELDVLENAICHHPHPHRHRHHHRGHCLLKSPFPDWASRTGDRLRVKLDSTRKDHYCLPQRPSSFLWNWVDPAAQASPGCHRSGPVEAPGAEQGTVNRGRTCGTRNVEGQSEVKRPPSG